MQILIIEDECLLADELEEKLMRIDASFNVVAKLQSVEDAVEWLNNNVCDLIFMDIRLSDGISFSIFDKTYITCPVIFTTAYHQYAIQAFDVNSIAYILKPIEDAEIRKALQKYETVKQSYSANLRKLIREYLPQKPDYKERFILTQGSVRKVVSSKDITCFQADDRYVFVFTTLGQRFFCNHTLKELDTLLHPHYFFRINRTFIVNRESIKEWTSHGKGRIRIILKQNTPEDLIVSQSRINEFKTWLQNY